MFLNASVAQSVRCIAQLPFGDILEVVGSTKPRSNIIFIICDML